MKLRFEKCKWGVSELKYLGYIVSVYGIKPDPSKIEAITKYPQPQTLQELQRFLGMCVYFLKNVSRFAEIAAPLYDLMSGKPVCKLD